MVCDLCKEGEAVIQLTEIQGSGVRQLHLCEKCAAERGVETTINAAKPQINNFLQTIHEQMPGAKGEAAHCQFCSGTLADFRATGRLGCAHCYETFESSLRDLLRRVHGNSRHIGRRYVAPLPSALPHVSSATELRDRLKRAVEAEQFELAADIRDKLRGIE
ncbi:MAG TPA: UvrB/UvrC motif-containing protein [Gemmatimonadaceae bacterium]|nr:UvrB/UvrC motif-containing protein [Gemmatimonadaceae bacterium]